MLISACGFGLFAQSVKTGIPELNLIVDCRLLACHYTFSQHDHIDQSDLQAMMSLWI